VAKGLSEFSNHEWNIPAEENVHKCTEVHAGGHVPRNDGSNGPSSIDERRCKRASLFAILAKERLQSPGQSRDTVHTMASLASMANLFFKVSPMPPIVFQ
jgi:hypothetical protein